MSCKLSQSETIRMKYQNLFSEKNKKNIINLSSAELARRMENVKPSSKIVIDNILKHFVFFFQTKNVSL